MPRALEIGAMPQSGRGASSGRQGGKVSTSSRRKRAFSATVPARVISHFPKSKARSQGLATGAASAVCEQMASPVRVGAAAAGAVSTMFPNISPNTAGNIAAVALAAAAAAQAQSHKGKGKGKAAATPAPPSARSLLVTRHPEPKKRKRSDDEEASPIRPPPLSRQPRGAQVVVQPKASYGDYSFQDICAVGELIRQGKVTIHQLRKPNNPVFKKHGVPASTMADWSKEDALKVRADPSPSPNLRPTPTPGP